MNGIEMRLAARTGGREGADATDTGTICALSTASSVSEEGRGGEETVFGYDVDGIAD